MLRILQAGKFFEKNQTETDFFWIIGVVRYAVKQIFLNCGGNFDQNNAKEGRQKFDKLKVGGLILMVK